MKNYIEKKIKIIWQYIRFPFDWIITEYRYRKKLKKLKEQDPFIYD